jgi:PhnB protein
MQLSSQPIPPGFRTVTVSLTVSNAAEAIEFYKKALGAEEIMRMAGPDGRIGHAELKIGDSIVFLNDEMPGGVGCPKSPQALGGTSGSVYLYVEDVDKSFEQAVHAGGKSNMPVMDMFWGDRFGGFVDPFGHSWGLATHTRDLSPEEIEEGARAFWAQMAEMAQKKSA